MCLGRTINGIVQAGQGDINQLGRTAIVFDMKAEHLTATGCAELAPTMFGTVIGLQLALALGRDLLARAERVQGGLRWVQAEHRVRPELLQAQTGYMQGAAGVGLFLLRLDGQQMGRPPALRLPDDPFRRP